MPRLVRVLMPVICGVLLIQAAVTASSSQSGLAAAIAAAQSAVASTLPAPEARDLIAAYDQIAGAPLWLDSSGALASQGKAGCIRVEDPARLAEWVLTGSGEWPRDRVLAAMNGAPNRRVDLARPVQVIIFYTTVVVQPEDGSVHFAEDLYAQDGPLDRAL